MDLFFQVWFTGSLAGIAIGTIGLCGFKTEFFYRLSMASIGAFFTLMAVIWLALAIVMLSNPISYVP